MQYRSVADLNDTIIRNLHKLPRDITAVVGVPRSGLLAANLLCLALNVRMTDVDGFLEGKFLALGRTKQVTAACKDGKPIVVVIDDSVRTGTSMQEVRSRLDIRADEVEFLYCVAYGVSGRHKFVDTVLEVVPLPRVFQWNVMHNSVLGQSCVDIDGVLCRDPTDVENDDGARYADFLANATPLLLPTRRIGVLVTNRLEKYRSQTTSWLARHGIEYDESRMLNLPSAEERRRLRIHATHKAEVYKESAAIFFIESDLAQAEVIALKSGKPVLCIESQHVLYPDPLTQSAFLALPQRLRAKNINYWNYWKYRLLSTRLGSFFGRVARTFRDR